MTILQDIRDLEVYKCSMPMMVPFVKLHTDAQAPSRAHNSDAGFDLYTVEDVTLSYDHPTTVAHTGIAMAIPEEHYGRVASRSGLSVKNNIEVGAGVIDSGYRGEIMVKLHLFHAKPGDEPVVLQKGSRVAQLIVTPCPSVNMVLVDDSLDDTTRASAGFGSSGK